MHDPKEKEGSVKKSKEKRNRTLGVKGEGSYAAGDE